VQIQHPRLNNPLLHYTSVDRRSLHRIALHCKTRSRPIVSTVWGSTCVCAGSAWLGEVLCCAVLCCTVGGSGIFGFEAHPVWTSLPNPQSVQQDSGYTVSELLELISSQAAVAYHRIASSTIIVFSLFKSICLRSSQNSELRRRRGEHKPACLQQRNERTA